MLMSIYLVWVEDEGLGVFTFGSKFLRNMYQRGSFLDSSFDYVMQNVREKKKNSISWGSTNHIDLTFCVRKIERVLVRILMYIWRDPKMKFLEFWCPVDPWICFNPYDGFRGCFWFHFEKFETCTIFLGGLKKFFLDLEDMSFGWLSRDG